MVGRGDVVREFRQLVPACGIQCFSCYHTMFSALSYNAFGVIILCFWPYRLMLLSRVSGVAPFSTRCRVMLAALSRFWLDIRQAGCVVVQMICIQL